MATLETLVSASLGNARDIQANKVSEGVDLSKYLNSTGFAYEMMFNNHKLALVNL